jgi:hypothetical protein
MTKIESAEDLVVDWAWFACDEAGNIAHFTTAGLRDLPHSVKQDREALEYLEHYLLEDREEWSECSIRAGVETDARGWRDAVARDLYLRSFIRAGRRGMFSYDTEIDYGPNARYYLVAKPDKLLQMTDLPPEITVILSKTRAPLTFSTRDYITETETLDW